MLNKLFSNKLLATIILALFPTACYAADQPPNIIVILVDDLGPMDLGTSGSTFYETPNIDALAASGMKFTRAYSTHPRCVPSRVGFFSGQFSVRFGVPGFVSGKSGRHALPLAAVTFAEHLKTAGYRTGYIGKWHLGKKGGGPEKQGFDYTFAAGQWGAPPSHFAPYEIAKRGKGKGFDQIEAPEGESLTARLTQEAIEFINSSPSDDPYLLVLAHYAVHTPIEAKESDTRYFQKKAMELGLPKAGRAADEDVRTDRTGKVKTISNNPRYAAMIRDVDSGVGKLLAQLEKSDQSENTIVILTSDHGGLSSRGLKNKRELATSNLPFRHGKGWLYEGGIRVPLIIRWPGLTDAGGRNDALVAGTDIYPTILEMAGLDPAPDDHIDGVSIKPLLAGATVDRSPLFFHSPVARPGSTGDTNSTALIDRNWKIIHWYDEGRWELFDLSEDPGEQANLVESHPQRFNLLRQELNNYADKLGAKRKVRR